MMVLLENGSIGLVIGTEKGTEGDIAVGSWVIIAYHDENGGTLDGQGRVLEILEDDR